VRGKTLGLIGYGAIGEAIARRARAFGMRVVVVRRSADQRPPELDAIYRPEELPALLAESDFVVLALPLTEATRDSFGAAELELMKPGAYLINIARGAIVRQQELIAALRAGTIAGAALDVFETEPLPEDSPLWEMENVIVTPHSAGGFEGFGAAVVDLFLENVGRWVAGRELLNRVEPDAGY
jgi:phosphoglycerate dehydrogenase-like enzyme